MNSKAGTIAAALAFVAVLMAFFWFGLNTGVMVSMRDGPQQACQSLRFSLLICDEQEAK